ncbi:MAG: dephospho-CoA kinase [Rhodoluna sp.]|nr:dephospho-CoA kinase [Rhodoluna sp.]
MYLVGLTGGIASGKSYVASLLGELGASTVDADQVAREVVVPGSTGLVQVVGAFGFEILSHSGELDRAKLGEIVFADPEKRIELENILHPLIKARTLQLISEQPSEIVVYAVPLLVEANVDYPFDTIITVEAGVENQVSRLMTSRRMSESEAKARIEAQTTSIERVARANYVIDSSGPKDQTRLQVVEVWRQLLEAAKAKR